LIAYLFSRTSAHPAFTLPRGQFDSKWANLEFYFKHQRTLWSIRFKVGDPEN